MRIPRNKSMSLKIARMIYDHGPMAFADIHARSGKHTHRVMHETLSRMEGDEQIVKSGDLYDLTIRIRMYFDQLEKKMHIARDLHPVGNEAQTKTALKGKSMTSFCVFGVTRAQCKKVAESKIKSYCPALKRDLTQEEYSARVDALAQQLFERGMVRPKQISPAFDAPQFAMDWIEFGKKSQLISSPKIMVRAQKTDKHGALMMNKKGLAVIGRVPYVR